MVIIYFQYNLNAIYFKQKKKKKQKQKIETTIFFFFSYTHIMVVEKLYVLNLIWLHRNLQNFSFIFRTI
jgi:hypothetical protein